MVTCELMVRLGEQTFRCRGVGHTKSLSKRYASFKLLKELFPESTSMKHIYDLMQTRIIARNQQVTNAADVVLAATPPPPFAPSASAPSPPEDEDVYPSAVVDAYCRLVDPEPLYRPTYFFIAGGLTRGGGVECVLRILLREHDRRADYRLTRVVGNGSTPSLAQEDACHRLLRLMFPSCADLRSTWRHVHVLGQCPRPEFRFDESKEAISHLNVMALVNCYFSGVVKGKQARPVFSVDGGRSGPFSFECSVALQTDHPGPSGQMQIRHFSGAGATKTIAKRAAALQLILLVMWFIVYSEVFVMLTFPPLNVI